MPFQLEIHVENLVFIFEVFIWVFLCVYIFVLPGIEPKIMS